MPLRLTIKPGDAMYIGTAKVMIDSDGSYTTFNIEGDLPVLRSRDFIEPGEHPSKATELYVLLQTAYLANDFEQRRAEYFARCTELITAIPSANAVIGKINHWLGEDNLYKALRAGSALLEI